ncbi:hypothetical protein GON01_08720 [Sphingomonas sp. MAH-20]|jgi:hypothetical protein|uniref:Uncharacterized protein n=2 Tax=Sphingomonadaceae TaxID=41297 RepID=A0A6I4J0P1_9SPHN|nr:hypothetical protein [Sphingomonas horti]MBA2919774.1 hypothetical protein [Sphingomonas sp. CGMCC 1.13658]MVO78015.1 hypothetical protein [Sphingomonas horti]
MIDRVVFGDNQFFGINHMSQDKASEQAKRFADLDRIFEVYGYAFEAGIRAVMLNSNDRALAICDRFRAMKSQLPPIAWYPSIPYPHKYAGLVAEKGMVGALQGLLFADGAGSALGKIAQGAMATLSFDAVRLMRMLVDQEMTIFRGLDVRVVFLQNIIVDLMLGFETPAPFIEYCSHIRKRYGAKPGLITQNLPLLHRRLVEWGIKDVVICSSINKIGYLMSPDRASYEAVIAQNHPADYQFMAMSTLASGAIPPTEAYAYINQLNIQSIVFGASSRANIEKTVASITGGGEAQ